MILRPTKFQRHCSDRLPSQEKQCGAAEEVLALTVCTVWDPGKGPFLSPHVPTYMLARCPTLFSSHLWVSMPSHLEDGFSCYFLNKIEL